MRKVLMIAAFVCFLGGRAEASTDVNVITSSGTFSGVGVTTGTVIRVDNFIHGSRFSVITSTRIGIEIQNQDSTYNIWCGYDVTIATSASAARPEDMGYRIGPGDTRYVGMLRTMQYNCICADAAGTNRCWTHVEQVYKE